MSPRLQQLEELNGQGLSNKEKAEVLGLSVKTIETYQNRLHHTQGETWAVGRPRKDHVPNEDRDTWRETLSERAKEITNGWRAAEVGGAVEQTAALNYWRGRAEEYNATRDTLVKAHPTMAKDLPPALEVDDIRVRQRVLEREQDQTKGLALAR